MKKILTTILLVIAHYGTSQTDTTLNTRNISKNSLYAEFLGNGILGSINYDRLFFIKKMKFSARIGILHIPESKKYVSGSSVPIELNLLLGKKHHVEFGFGVTYANNLYTNSDSIGNTISSKSIYLMVKPVAYRFQKPNGGIFINASALLAYKAFEFNKNYISHSAELNFFPFLGIAIGYTFKNKKS